MTGQGVMEIVGELRIFHDLLKERRGTATSAGFLL
jgi:hypothetical protein